jgi:hypothetical protein
MIHAIESKVPPKDGTDMHEQPRRRGQRKRKHTGAPATDAFELSVQPPPEDAESQLQQPPVMADPPPVEDELGGALDLKA